MIHRKIFMGTILFGATALFIQQGFAESTADSSHLKQTLFEKGSQQSFQGPEAFFTGDVKVDLLFPGNDTAHYSGAYVTFQPGARTAWHSHPAGQHMIMISGIGLTGTRDGKIIQFKPGDTVWCPPNHKHWHGATATTGMSHIAVQEMLDGKNVTWLEPVTDEQYGK